jgi:hypothetical protein
MQLEIYGGVPVPNQHVEVCTTVNSKASNVLYSFVCIVNLWFRVQSQSQRGGRSLQYVPTLLLVSTLLEVEEYTRRSNMIQDSTLIR